MAEAQQTLQRAPHLVLDVPQRTLGLSSQHGGSLAPMKRRVAAAAAGLTALVGVLVFTPHRVPDDAMAPSIQAGEWVILGPVWGLEPGDVVVVEDPTQPGRTVMRRLIVELGDEELEVQGGLLPGGRYREMGRGEHRVVMNENDLYLVRRLNREFHEAAHRIQGPGLAVLADDRDGPLDSRWWGALPEDAPKRRVWLRLGGPDDLWRSPVSWRAMDGPWIPPSRVPQPEAHDRVGP